jgi:hypothetical protein
MDRDIDTTFQVLYAMGSFNQRSAGASDDCPHRPQIRDVPTEGGYVIGDSRDHNVGRITRDEYDRPWFREKAVP